MESEEHVCQEDLYLNFIPRRSWDSLLVTDPCFGQVAFSSSSLEEPIN